MAVCRVPSLSTTQSSLCYMDAVPHSSQASEHKHLTHTACLSQSKALSCLSSTMVNPGEPDDTATSELRTSTGLRSLQAHELELSMSNFNAAQITAVEARGVDIHGENFQASLGRSKDVEERSISSTGSGEIRETSLVGLTMKRTRTDSLGFSTEESEVNFKNETLQLNCCSLPIAGDGPSVTTVAGANMSALPCHKNVSWVHAKAPIDWKLGMSWSLTPNHCLSQPLLSQQLSHCTAGMVEPVDIQHKKFYEQPICHPYLCSESHYNGGLEGVSGTVMPMGLVGLESAFVQGKPEFSLRTFAAADELMTSSLNTASHMKDETPPFSTGTLHGIVPEAVTSHGYAVLEPNHLPTELGQKNFAQLQSPLTEIWQQTPVRDFPSGALEGNMCVDFHNGMVRTGPFEGYQAQGLSSLPLARPDVNFIPTFGLSLTPDFSNIQPNTAIPKHPFAIQESSVLLPQNVTASPYAGMRIPFQPSMQLDDSLMCYSGPQVKDSNLFQSLRERPGDSGITLTRGHVITPIEGQQTLFNNSFAFLNDRSTLISDLNLSLLVHDHAPISTTSAPCCSFPSSSATIASELHNSGKSQSVPAGQTGLKLSRFSHKSPDLEVPLLDPNDSEVPPSITVVMEGRSIGGRICLQNLDGYESFARSIRHMLRNNIPEDSLSSFGDDCHLSNAIPGFVIAYEDTEGDLLLAGDLSWRDFVHVAKRIRVVPAKNNKAKGTCANLHFKLIAQEN